MGPCFDGCVGRQQIKKFVRLRGGGDDEYLQPRTCQQVRARAGACCVCCAVWLVHPSSATQVTLHAAAGPVTVLWSDGKWLPSPASAALYIALAFRFLSRFVDDLYAINCPLLSSLTYTSQSFPGFPEFTGIYPPALKPTGSGASLDFLDVTISPTGPGD